jgi:hypothetical protein
MGARGHPVPRARRGQPAAGLMAKEVSLQKTRNTRKPT